MHQQIERLGSGYPMQRECLPHNVILLQLRAGQCPLARAENSRIHYTCVSKCRHKRRTSGVDCQSVFDQHHTKMKVNLPTSLFQTSSLTCRPLHLLLPLWRPPLAPLLPTCWLEDMPVLSEDTVSSQDPVPLLVDMASWEGPALSEGTASWEVSAMPLLVWEVVRCPTSQSTSRCRARTGV